MVSCGDLCGVFLVGFFCHSFEIFLWKFTRLGIGIEDPAYCAMIMAEVLDIAYVSFGAKGSSQGKVVLDRHCDLVSWIVAWTEAGQVEPDG